MSDGTGVFVATGADAPWCPDCKSATKDTRNPLGYHEETEEYEWCRNPWHKPFFFDPPLEEE